MKQHLCNGYYRIRLSKNNIVKNHKVHRLVAFAFCNNDNDYPVVDHLDRDPLNNHFLNLRWATESMNARNKSTSSNNTSGEQGVSFNTRYNSWSARWSDNEGNKKSKSFSVRKHGDAQAKQLAINVRAEMETLFGYI